MLRFHIPAHRTGRADLPHPALRQASPNGPRRRLCSRPLRRQQSRLPERLGFSRLLGPKTNRWPLVLSYGVLEVRPLGSLGVTQGQHYYEPLRLPSRSDLLLAEFPLWVGPTSKGISRVPVGFFFQACWRHYPGGTARCCRYPVLRRRPSPVDRRVGFHDCTVSRPARRSRMFRPACSHKQPFAAC